MEAVRKVLAWANGRRPWTRRRWKILGGTGSAFLVLLMCAVGCDFLRWRKMEFISAAVDGDVKGVRSQLKQGADPNDGLYPAAINGRTEILALLIANGAQVSGKAGTTVLCQAILYKQLSSVNYLLAHGANANAPDEDTHTTPLLRAMDVGSWPMFQTLVAHGAKIDMRNSDNGTALMHAAGTGEEDSIRICRYLIAHGANVNAADNRGATALIYVTCKGPRYGDGNDGSYPPVRLEMLHFLLRSGANVNARDSGGYTALRYAAGYRNGNAKALLKKAGGHF